MTDQPDASPAPEGKPPRWQPLGAMDRRVLGVLAEKAKTTPDAYPLSLNAICTGCNQKNNRAPLMQLVPDDVEPALDRLRELGAVGIVQGYGRVSKYRHYLYEWLGVDKVELAVMTELLLRGAQTEGELRGRAARMEPIAGLAELRPVLQSLKSKGLLVALTPEGRGHVVTHNLHPPAELERLRTQYRAAALEPPESPAAGAAACPATAAALPRRATEEPDTAALRREFEAIRQELAELRQQLADMAGQFHHVTDEIQRLHDALGG